LKIITYEEIKQAFEELKIVGKRVVIHSSLSSFGNVEGGENTVIKAIQNSFKTVMMPAFCWDSNTYPPKGDRPFRNGCDYAFYDNWSKKDKPFIVQYAGIEKSMGIISKTFLSVKGVERSDHPWHSWACYGEYSDKIIENHSYETTNLPLERLLELDGHIVLIGVDLSSCTAIHIAEERVGRQPLIRWVVDKNGITRRVRASSCGKGFINLNKYCEKILKQTKVGNCIITTMPMEPFISHITSVISKNPEITKCSSTCIKCRDSILGGPINE